MKQSQFNFFKKIIFLLIFTLMFFAIITGNMQLAIFSVLIGLLALRFLKKQVKDVLIDERIELVGQKAARATLSIFASVMSIISLLLLSLGRQDDLYPRALGIIFSYTTIFILFLYLLTYWFFDKELGGNEK